MKTTVTLCKQAFALFATFVFYLESHAQSIVQSNCIGTADSEFAYDVRPTPDGGLIYAGSIEAPAGDATPRSNGLKDFLIIKYSSSGSLQWLKNYGGTQDDIARSITITPQGEYIVAGCSYSDDGDVTDHIGTTGECDIWLLWLNQDGEIIQSKSYGSDLSEFAVGIQLKNENPNQMIMLCEISSTSEDINSAFGGKDIWLTELDINGNINWQKTFGNTGDDHPYDLLLDANDNIYIGATTDATGAGSSDNETLIIHTDEDGITQWEKTIGTTSVVGIGTPGKLSFDTDGRLLLPMVGSVTNDNMNCDAHGSFLFKILDNDGEIEDSFCFGGTGEDKAIAMLPASNGNYWLLGTTDSDDMDVPAPSGYTDESTNVWLAEITESGEIVWKKTLGGSLGEEAVNMHALGNGSILLTINSNSNNGDVSGSNDPTGNTHDIWSLQIATQISYLQDESQNEFEVYPNPATDRVNFKVKNGNAAQLIRCFDVNGRMVMQENISNSVQSFSVEMLPEGLYMIQWTDPNGKMLHQSTFVRSR